MSNTGEKKPKVLHANYLASSRSETRVLMAQSDVSSLVFNLDTASVARLKNRSEFNCYQRFYRSYDSNEDGCG
ncbi:hypothetical protein M6G44_00190 [Actinobacillus pleuropneumoniae]|nr:hypothetical protein M6G44_00190 [Actinobacillus pleuropneumoniae]